MMKTPQELFEEEKNIFLSILEECVLNEVDDNQISSLGGSVTVAAYQTSVRTGATPASFLQELHPKLLESVSDYFQKSGWSSSYKYYCDGPSMSTHTFVLRPL